MPTASFSSVEETQEALRQGKIVLVMGNEGEGLARLTMDSCDFLVKLPQEGKVGSLNVAQAATACMYEFLRQNRPARVRDARA